MNDDNLSDEARRLREAHDRRMHKSGEKESKTTSHKVAYEMKTFGKFFSSIFGVAVWMWWNFGNPIINKITVPFFLKFGSFYIDMWDRFTSYKDKYGNKKTSKYKGAVFIASTWLIFIASFQLFFFTLDTGLYYTTVQRNQAVWLSSAQEIDPGSNVFAMQGCEITAENENGISSCDEGNSLYYRTSPSIFNGIWSVTHGKGLFFPDLVVAPIGADWSKCVATTYGIRARIFIFFWDIYPNLLSASCERKVTS